MNDVIASYGGSVKNSTFDAQSLGPASSENVNTTCDNINGLALSQANKKINCTFDGGSTNHKSANATFDGCGNATFDGNEKVDGTFISNIKTNNGACNSTFDGAVITNRKPLAQPCIMTSSETTQHRPLKSRVTFGPMSVIPDLPRKVCTEFDKLQSMVASTKYRVGKFTNNQGHDVAYGAVPDQNGINSTFEAVPNVNTTFGKDSESNAINHNPNINLVNDVDFAWEKDLKALKSRPSINSTFNAAEATEQNATFDHEKELVNTTFQTPDEIAQNIQVKTNSTFDTKQNDHAEATQILCADNLHGGQHDDTNSTFNKETVKNANCTFDHILSSKASNTTFDQVCEKLNSTFDQGVKVTGKERFRDNFATNTPCASPIRCPVENNRKVLCDGKEPGEENCNASFSYFNRSYTMPCTSPDTDGLNASINQLCQSQSYSCINLMDAEPPILKHILKMEPGVQEELRQRFASPSSVSFLIGSSYWDGF